MNFNSIIPNEIIQNKIFFLRDQKIILDADLADLYQVETKYLKRQVKRNSDRFPEDFMFELTPAEMEILRCHFGTSSWGGSRYQPMAFTEQGIAMLSSVLGSPVAIGVNIQIIRVFTNMRKTMSTQQEILSQVRELEERMIGQDEKIQAIFECMKELLRDAITDRPPIGFRQKS